MSHHDRRARAARADADPRHRPSAGFRTVDRSRFARLARQSVGEVDADLRPHLVGADLTVLDAPDLDDPTWVVDGEVVPAVLRLPTPASPGTVTVLRRPLELRADSAAALRHALVVALTRAVTDALGQPPRHED